MRDEKATTNAQFTRFVNLAARELEHWLATADSAAAGDHAEGAEVLRLLRTPAAERTDADVAAMNRVVAHVRAERERRPDGDPTAWRAGLMNWGHDPLTWSEAPIPASALASPGKLATEPRSGPLEPPGDARRG